MTVRRACSYLRVALSACLAGGLVACERDSGSRSGSAEAAPAATQPTAADLAAVKRMLDEQGQAQNAVLPPGHPPVHSPTPVFKLLKYEAPSAWQQVPPAIPMRLAQYAIPRASGDERDGTLTVSHFPGAGGSVDLNVQRWIGQFSTAEGRPIDPATVHRETLDINGLGVTIVEMTGYCAVSAMTSGSGRPSETEYRLLGAIVETPTGPWFFKGWGPDATMAAAKHDFLNMIKSVHH